jgi:hypothetical protein
LWLLCSSCELAMCRTLEGGENQSKMEGCGYGSEIECLPSIRKVMGSIPSTAKHTHTHTHTRETEDKLSWRPWKSSVLEQNSVE